MKKQIVYCSECKYFQAPVEREYRSDIREACLHPSNKTRVDRYDGPIFVPAWKPDKKNEKCDCVLWVRKLSQEEIKQEQNLWIKTKNR